MESATFPSIGPLVLVTALGLLSFPSPAPAADDIIPVAEVTAGMKGYGLTVVSGDRIDRFGVEVLGVLPNSPSGRAQILVKVSGLGLEESGIVAGMSGSPVYLDGRLAGAIASGWGFSKQPIGGVTPIESMLGIDPAAAAPAPPRPATAGDSGVSAAVLQALALPEDERLAMLRKALDGFLPASLAASTPSLLAPAASGFPVETLNRFQEPLGRLGLPLLAASGGSTPASGPGPATPGGPAAPLTGGSSISALLVDGDLQLGVTGTVTRVEKDGRFVAFGHPFLGFGELELPVANARVVTVLPNAYQSFKLGFPVAPASYRLTKDRDTGVAGRTDRPAPMIPVRFRFESESGVTRTLEWRVAPHPRLLPILVALSCDAALTTSDPSPRDRTLHLRVGFETGAGEISYEDELTGPRAKDLALVTAATLAGLITENEYEEPRLSGVNLSFRSASGERRLKIVDAALATRRAAPGEEIAVTVRLADRRGAETSRAIRLTVPREAPEGRASLMVSDGSTASALRMALQPGEARSLHGMRRTIARLLPSDRLVAALIVPSRGAATGSDTFTALPPTAAALLADGDAGDSRPGVGARILAEEITPLGRPLQGSVRLELEIERPRS